MPRKIPYSECHGKGGWYGRTPGLITGIAYWHTCQKCNGHAEFEEETDTDYLPDEFGEGEYQ
jgi:hypothetical protein